MSQRRSTVAVIATVIPEQLRQFALWFDRLAIPDLTNLILVGRGASVVAKDARMMTTVQDLAILKTKSFFLEPQLNPETIAELRPEQIELTEPEFANFVINGQRTFTEMISSHGRMVEYAETLHKSSRPLDSDPAGLAKELAQRVKCWLDSCDAYHQYLVKLLSVQLSKSAELHAIPIYRNKPFLPSRPAKTFEVLQIVLKALPTPDSSVPWERIDEFRSDPEAIASIAALRRWINETARHGLTGTEVEDELDYLLEVYEKHLSLHEMKYRHTSLEAFVVTGAGVLEDLVRFKFSSGAKRLFDFKRRRVAMVEEKQKLPGSEVAYVVQAKSAFSD